MRRAFEIEASPSGAIASAGDGSRVIDAIGFGASISVPESERPEEPATVTIFGHEAHDPELRSHHGIAAFLHQRRGFEIGASPMGMIASLGDR